MNTATRAAAAIAVLVLAALASILDPATAHADEANVHAHTPTATVAYPLVNADGTVAHRVRLEAGARSWRIKQVARAWDAQLDGLAIEVGPCVAGIPCIRTYVGSYDADAMLLASEGHAPRWSGLTTFPEPGVRAILLNRLETPQQSDGRRRVASHELAHALGLGHNAERDGLMCAQPSPCDRTVWDWTPTAAEVAALSAYFAA